MSLLGGGRRLGGLGLGAARVMKKTNDDDESDGSEEELKPKQVYLQKSQNAYDKSPSMELDGDEDDGHGEMEMASSLLDILGGSTKNPPQPPHFLHRGTDPAPHAPLGTHAQSAHSGGSSPCGNSVCLGSSSA